MASLLERAKQIRDRLREKTEIDTIPETEREKIYDEIDRVVASKRLKIQEDTFSFTPIQSDIKLPVIVNITAFLLIAGLSIFFLVYFKQAETHIVAKTENVTTSESRLIEALKAESEQQLGEKEKEIKNIHGKLESMRLEQEKLISDSLEKASMLEAELRESYENTLEEERRKLQSEGLSAESVEQKLQDFEASKQVEFQEQIDSMRKQLEGERLAKEVALNNLITGYEKNLEMAKATLLAIEEELKQQYSKKEQQFTEKAQQLESERNTAIAKLLRFDELRKQEQLVINQIISMYTSINDSIKNNQYDKSLESLNNLENFINRENVTDLPAVLYRRGTDIFMIQSLRKLVETEKKQSDPDTDSLIESASILVMVSDIVEEGNRLYDQGNLEAAREFYIKAISRVPILDTGFIKLQDIENQDIEQAKLLEVALIESLEKELKGELLAKEQVFNNLIAEYEQNLEKARTDHLAMEKVLKQTNSEKEQQFTEKMQQLENKLNNTEARLSGFNELQYQERDLFINNLMEGDKYFQSGEFEFAIEKYHKALEYLENDSDIVDKIVNQLVDAGLGIETSEGNVLITPGEMTLLNNAKLQQKERQNLLKELYSVEEKYNLLSSEEKSDQEVRETLIPLLNTKLLITQVLTSNSVKEDYPDLYDKMGYYLEAYGKEKEQEGRNAALKEIVIITEYLSRKGNLDISDMAIATPEEKQQQELFLKFLNNLKEMLEMGG